MIYLQLFFTFLKVGAFAFGGGYAMLSLIGDSVLKYGWMTEQELLNFVGVETVIPGPIAVNMATYIGSLKGDLFGSIVATLGVVLPSFLIILLIAAIIRNFTDNKYFKGFIKGTKPVVSAIIISTGVILLLKSLGYISLQSFSFNFISVIIFAILTAVYFVVKKLKGKKLSSIQLILISAFLGILISLIAERI